MSFADPWNPTEKEIFRWAYSNENWPDQDFDLSLATSGHDRVILKIAMDVTCPKRDFFIHVLFFMVGDSIYSSDKERQRELRQLLNEIRDQNDSRIEQWINESYDLIDERTPFSYEYWCQHMFGGPTSKGEA